MTCSVRCLRHRPCRSVADVLPARSGRRPEPVVVDLPIPQTLVDVLGTGVPGAAIRISTRPMCLNYILGGGGVCLSPGRRHPRARRASPTAIGTDPFGFSDTYGRWTGAGSNDETTKAGEVVRLVKSTIGRLGQGRPDGEGAGGPPFPTEHIVLHRRLPV